MKKLRVFFLNSCVHGGGAGRSLEAYLSLGEESIEAHIVMPEEGVLSERLRNVKQIHYVPEFVERTQKSSFSFLRRTKSEWVHNVVSSLGLLWAMVKIGAIARRIEADVIYCNHMLAKPVGVVVGTVLGLPVIFHVRNIHTSWFGRHFFPFLGSLPAVKEIICNSEASAKCFLKRSPHKVRIVHNFVDLERYRRGSVVPTLRTQFSIPPDAQVIGYAGRIVPWKGIDVLLKSFRKVCDRNSRAVLVIVGGNDSMLHHDLEGEYRDLAATLGVADRTYFVGFQEDVRSYMADFDILALPSLEPEPFGRVVIEAMALGVPAVVFAHGGVREIVTHRKNGLWVDPGNSDALAHALLELLQDETQRRLFGAESAVTVRKQFSTDRLAGKITSAITSAAWNGRELEELDAPVTSRRLGTGPFTSRQSLEQRRYRS